MKPKKSLSMCCGCRDNFYNGNNNLGVKQCWNFPSAKVEKRIYVDINQRPPYDLKSAEWCMSCHKPNHAVQVRPAALTKEGFWK